MIRIGIPPNGVAGTAQQTTATLATLSQMMRGRSSTGGIRRKSRKVSRRKVRASSPKPKRRSSSKPARLVKGSAAAKRYMAKIRAKRRR